MRNWSSHVSPFNPWPHLQDLVGHSINKLTFNCCGSLGFDSNFTEYSACHDSLNSVCGLHLLSSGPAEGWILWMQLTQICSRFCYCLLWPFQFHCAPLTSTILSVLVVEHTHSSTSALQSLLQMQRKLSQTRSGRTQKWRLCAALYGCGLADSRSCSDLWAALPLLPNVDPNLIDLAQAEPVGLFQNPAAGAVRTGNHCAKTHERIHANPAGFTRVGLLPAWPELGSLRAKQVSFHHALSTVKLT